MLADVAACGGQVPITDYGTLIGFWLNVPRIRFQRAAMTLAGVAAASHNEPLEWIWGDALAMFAEEADEVLFEINAQRAIAKVSHRRGF